MRERILLDDYKKCDCKEAFNSLEMSDDSQKAFDMGIKTKCDYETAATVAQDRVQ